MDIFWLIVGLLFVLAGIIGSIIPFIPGPPLAFVGLLLQQLKSQNQFPNSFLLVFGVITVILFVLDYLIPIYGTKKWGGSKYGVWGSTAGLLVGIFFGPIGIIAGPFLGALLGEWVATSDSNQAFRSAIGSFIGFVMGTLIKFIACAVMGWYVLSYHFNWGF